MNKNKLHDYTKYLLLIPIIVMIVFVIVSFIEYSATSRLIATYSQAVPVEIVDHMNTHRVITIAAVLVTVIINIVSIILISVLGHVYRVRDLQPSKWREKKDDETRR